MGNLSALKPTLDHLYQTYDFASRTAHDPISLPRRYTDPLDIEVSGLIASSYAYGRVDLFLPIATAILDRMGPSPAGFLLSPFDPKKERPRFEGLRYRFYNTGDLMALLHSLSHALRTHGSLGTLMRKGYSEADPHIGPALAAFSAELLSHQIPSAYARGESRTGFSFYLPSPATGSACKRLCLYTRWMARTQDIDLGLWRWLPPSRLVIPLDTHIARISRCLGLTKRKNNSWATALEITNSLKSLDPTDPLKYDFALCHQGISGACATSKCSGCTLKNITSLKDKRH